MKPEAKGNPNAIVVRLKGRSIQNMGGQRRHDLRIGAQPNYVNSDLSHLNRVLIEPWTGPQLMKECTRRRDQRKTKRAMKSNAGIAQVGIVCFGLKAQKRFARLNKKQQDAAFLEISEAIAKQLKTTLTGLVVHRDESAIHAHFQLVGYDLSGEAVSQQTQKKHTSGLQDLAADVIKHYDPKIERGRKIGVRLEAGAKPHEVINKQVKTLHTDLPYEIHVLLGEIANLEAKKAKLIRYITKIEHRETKTAKQEKNHQIYQRRLDEREVELQEREQRLAELEATVADLEERQRKSEWAARRAEKRTADADDSFKHAWEGVEEAKRQEEEIKARRPEVLHPNRVDDLPAPLKKAIDESATTRGYLPLNQLNDDEKVQSTSSFLEGYLYHLASIVYQKMATTITALRRQLRAALGREKTLKQDLQTANAENTELRRMNKELNNELADYKKPSQNDELGL